MVLIPSGKSRRMAATCIGSCRSGLGSGTPRARGLRTASTSYSRWFTKNHVDLWAMRETGDLFRKVNHEPVRLTSGPLNFISPQANADGTKIYAVGEQPRSELVRYDAKSGQFLPYLGGMSISDVGFSPDGQWLAYSI